MAELFKNFLKAVQGRAGRSWESMQSLAELNPRYKAVLNGILGDALAERKSRLAIPMTLIGEVKGRKLCILVHGLCDSEETWRFSEDPSLSYGSLLQQDFGYTPLYLRYNTGLHISVNGRALAQKLTEIEESSPGAIQEILFIGHSMGGLVLRSACHYGQEAGANWARRVKKIFFLGSPHLGADLERVGNLTSVILGLIPNPFTRGLANLSNRRSAGIKDLRFGYLLDEDWKDQDPDALWKDNRHPVPLLEGAEHFLIAGSLAKEAENFLTRYFGDGLVASRSASGKSLRKKKSIPFPEGSFRVVRGVSHGSLARSPKVYEQIRKSCAAS